MTKAEAAYFPGGYTTMLRKVTLLTLACIILLVMPINALGAQNQKPIEIYINGVKVHSDVPPTILDGRTLVPLRVISENLGANVHWDNASRSVRVTTPVKTIVLKIDDKKVVMNDKEITLDVPAKIIGERTMVPLRFIGESLGAKVDWNNDERKVTIAKNTANIVDMLYEKTNNSSKVIIKGDGPLQYTAGPQTELKRICIDVSAKLQTDNNALYIDDEYLTKVIVGQINDQPTSRVVLDIKDDAYSIYQSQDKHSIIIAFDNTLKNISIEEDSKDLLVNLEMSKKAKFNYFFLTNPDRLVLDIEGALLSASVPHIPSNDYFKDIRVGQFSTNPNTVRVVFDLKDGVNYQVLESKGNILVNFTEPSKIEDISLKSEYDKTVIDISANDYISYEVKTDKKSKQIKLIIPGVLVDQNLLKKDIIDAKDGIIDFVKISKVKGYLEVTANLYSYTSHSVVAPSPTKNIRLEIYKSPMQNKLIVVDPGHGGSDPGAVVGNIKEKDLNLDIGLRLKQLLEEGGARVFMTRENDIYVDYFTTPQMANEIGADLFVSIHNNSATNSSASGTETLYYPDPEKKALAQAIQKALVKNIGLNDRGIKERPGLVVIRETKMPSALVEVGFLTNNNDLAQLKSDNFRQRAAEGIYEGIMEYLSGQN